MAHIIARWLADCFVFAGIVNLFRGAVYNRLNHACLFLFVMIDPSFQHSANQRPIYLDYAATTPVSPEVVGEMNRYLSAEGHFGNPASRSHHYGWEAEEAIEQARQQLATLVGCDPRELVWTSGATESDNLAIKGFLEANADSDKRHLITSTIEHSAVLDTTAYMETKGYQVTLLSPSAEGVIAPDQVQAALRPDTALVSIMHLNNEIGSINPIAEIAEITSRAGVVLHVDAAQSLGKLPLDLSVLSVDMMSFSGHKIYGPKGVGALYVRRDSALRLAAQMHGGGHENEMRSGTLPTHQIVGMGQAAQICGSKEDILNELKRMDGLRSLFLDRLYLPMQCQLNGGLEGYPGILNIAFPQVDGETLLMALSPDIAASTGSACNSIKVEPSHVLIALQIGLKLADSSLRFSFGKPTSEEEVIFATDRIRLAIDRLSHH